MSSVLYDVPGPRARVRHRIYTVVGGLGVFLLLAFLAWQLWEADQITPRRWSFLNSPSIVQGLAEGLLTTFAAAASAIVLAVAFGAVFATGRLSDHWWLRLPSIAVIEFFRAVPVLLLIFFLFFAYGHIIGAYWSVVFALMLYNGSVLAEIFRAGVLAVPKGQREAAMAIGLRKGQILRLIQAPQAVTTMLPAIISQCVVALKDTALGYAIGAAEITREGQRIFTSIQYNNPIAVGLVLLTVFVIVNYALSKVAQWLEGRMRQRGKEVVYAERSAYATEGGGGGL